MEQGKLAFTAVYLKATHGYIGFIEESPARTWCANPSSLPFLVPSFHFWLNTQPTSLRRSASDKPGFGGIGTWPQVPWPPSRIFVASFSAASASPAYFCATSPKEGPTTRWLTAWQPAQPLALSSFWMGSSPAAAIGSAGGAGAGLSRL